MDSYREMKSDLLAGLGYSKTTGASQVRRVYHFTLFRRRFAVIYTKGYSGKRVVRMLSIGVAHGR